MGESAVCAEIPTDGNMIVECPSGTELKTEDDCLKDNVESESFIEKKQAKEEAVYDDIKSEVSNPIVSPKEITSSFHDIISQQIESDTVNRVGCDKVTCTSSEETLSEADRSESSQTETSRNNNTSGDVSTSHVVLEIPKHLSSSSGIRKITFKFSKRKEDYLVKSSAPLGNEEAGSHSVYDDVYSYRKDSPEGSHRHLCAPNMEIKMSKKVVPNEYPTNVKKLLLTGILDGARVKYISTQKRKLDGIINGGGYLCGCPLCNFSKVVSAHEFEQHAGVKTRHPNNHIYLDNGKPIYSIIQELKSAPLGILEEVVKNVAGSSVNEGSFQVWKASVQQSNGMVEQHEKFNASCFSLSLEESISPSSCSFVQKNGARHQLYTKEMLEEQKRGVKRPSSYSSVTQQKRTAEGGTKRRDNDLHRLLFLPNGLPDGELLTYIVKGQRLRAGYKQGNGIVCGCCNREISPSQFEAHAGMAARRQPYRHIYTSNGLTLHDIAMSLAHGRSRSTGGSDDMCTICGDGGSLLLCYCCPRAFHPACLDLQWTPEGDWHCPNCREKFGPDRVDAVGDSSSMARSMLLQRDLELPEIDIGGCVVCRAHDFSAGIFDDRTVIYCDQCEKEFHVGCLRDSGLCDLKEIPKDKWFCCDDCTRIHVALQDSVSNGAQMISASLLSTINKKHLEKGIFSAGAANDVQWRILRKAQSMEEKSLLSSTTAIFRECFDPIVAECGRDLIPLMVYGRNISGQEFGGIYSVILMVNSVVVSAGLLRIFGREVAELPLVATSRGYQGKGCFQALFSCIERLLCSLNVENLVLPAAEKAESIWTKKFGFRRMSKEQLSKYQREMQLTIFKGTSMLEKKVQYQSENSL
ncbi:uncharacterized protein LOC116117995 [Pistacia vera]|uniref:uncharacterized protein LOC116117995 n=1 Tax=Pistacia vera TaxID=55513 RepID=UPI001263314C|nr:uncharacterized protein LOC116117995 [Pistacia vera]XP_031259837.1 uncharacterized protein LOC116117995 [Pistacia vera]XP_031259838.1 uncharacterized protein LOC116117995 [Pistacia vera]